VPPLFTIVIRKYLKMSKIATTRAQLTLELNQGLKITIERAAKILPTVSRTTLYRWSKQGIDNEPAKALLTLYTANRVIPPVRQWQGFTVDDNGQIHTPSGQSLYPSQIDQYGWILAMWHKNLTVLSNINDSLTEIRETRPDVKRALTLVTDKKD
jgi:hypothetical protein